MAVSALSAGLKCRCPNCGEGQVFAGFLRFKTVTIRGEVVAPD